MLLTLEEGGTMELIDDLRNERIDAAFIRTTIASQEGLVGLAASPGGKRSGYLHCLIRLIFQFLMLYILYSDAVRMGR